MLIFAHPAMLGFLALAAVPVLLHLLSRLAPPVLRFPTMRFLRPSPLPLRGRRSWKDLLLMALRCAVVAVLALLAAGPRWQPREKGNTVSQDARRGCAVLLDSSASMRGYREVFLAQLRGSLPSSAEIAVFGAEELSSWQPGFGTGTIAETLPAVGNWLQEFPPAGREVHVVTDLQECDWSAALAESRGVLPEGTAVFLHTLATPVHANCSVTGTQVTPLPDGALRVAVSLRNWGASPEKRTVSIWADDAQLCSEQTELFPGLEMPLVFVISQPIDPSARVVLSPKDGFAFDDERYFMARAEAPHAALAVFAGEDTALSDELELFCIPALTAEPTGVTPQYEVSQLDVTGLPFADLSDQSLLCLLGAADRLDKDPALLEKIRSFVESGGVLLAVPGAFPQGGWQALQAAGILSRRSGAALAEHRPTGIGALPKTSSLAGLFPEKSPSDLHLFSIRRWLRVTPSEEDTVLLQTLEGTPALLERRLGKGRVFAFCFGFDLDASDFALTKSFVPMLRELLSQALADHSETIRLDCGETLPDLRSLTGEGTLPDANVPPAATAQPGCFRLGRHPVDVNPPRCESIPVYLSGTEVHRALTPATSSVNAPAGEPAQLPRSLAPHLALLLIALLLAEGILRSR